MEQASSAREFIQRFHLPQLVRIVHENQSSENSDNENLEDTTSFIGERADCNSDRDTQQVSSSRAAPDSIRLAPTSKRPTLSKLQLEQPFLVYKAYKKLELLAYANDSKNELNVRSGDPIYFPHNYKGWFSLHSSQTRKSFHLSTIEQVCLSSGQVFLSRDQLIGYQLPEKLSELTKLGNNQLLALPLAINLSNQSHGSKSTQSSDKSHSNGPISELKPITLEVGQVLRLCGVYEDVLPLIGQQQHQQPQVPLACKPNGALPGQIAGEPMDQLKPQDRMAPPLIYRPNGPQTKTTTGAGKRYARCIVLSERSVDRITGCTTEPWRGADPNNGTGLTGANASIASPRQKPSSSLAQACDSDQSSAEEFEVLIPLNQVGRFYLCATNQTIADELHCQGCSGSARNIRNLVFRLSQLVYLINMTRRLARWQPQQQQQQQQQHHRHQQQQQRQQVLWRPLAAFDLPMQVRLVIGERPANFSPTMLGSSSTMECYFADESNVGGHILECRFNRRRNINGTNQSDASVSTNLSGGSSLLANEPVCACAMRLVEPTRMRAQKSQQQQQQSSHKSLRGTAKLSLHNSDRSQLKLQDPSYGFFSGSFRLEELIKRDVLLACTIKSDPLEHLNNAHPTAKINRLAHNRLASSTSKHATVAHRISWRKQPQLSPSLISSDQQVPDMSLPFNLGADSKQVSSSSHLSNVAGSKSSFSRLRACRSLISLSNAARRKKQRPKIPDSMMQPQRRQQCTDDLYLDKQMRSLAISHGCNLSTSGGASGGGCSGSGSNSDDPTSYTPAADAYDPIVLVEFDCDDARVRFVRTFVESSLPTASIPNLVLKRMDYCARNSYDWERQVKLSYATLGRDFEICRRQMAAASRMEHLQRLQAAAATAIEPPRMRKRQLASRRTSADTSGNFTGELAAAAAAQLRRGSTAADGSSSFALARFSATHSSRSEMHCNDEDDEEEAICSPTSMMRLRRIGRANRALVGVSYRSSCELGAGVSGSGGGGGGAIQSTGNSVDASTASSRSSSGVSSAGERVGCGANSTGSQAKMTQAATLASSGCSTSEEPAAIASSAAASDRRRATASSSRLLRLVQRILPASSRSKLANEEEEEHRGRASDRCDGGASDDVANDLGRRRRRKVRPSLAPNRPPEGASSANSNMDDDDDDELERSYDNEECASHLYESLERLNGELNRQRRIGFRQQQQAANKREPSLSWHAQAHAADPSAQRQRQLSSQNASTSRKVDRCETLDMSAARRARRPKAAAATVAASSNNFERVRMEPMSIEACDDVSLSLSYLSSSGGNLDEAESSSSLDRSSGGSSSFEAALTPIGASEHEPTYANLAPDFDGGGGRPSALSSAAGKLRGACAGGDRMQRRILRKLRAQRAGSISSGGGGRGLCGGGGCNSLKSHSSTAAAAAKATHRCAAGSGLHARAPLPAEALSSGSSSASSSSRDCDGADEDEDGTMSTSSASRSSWQLSSSSSASAEIARRRKLCADHLNDAVVTVTTSGAQVRRGRARVVVADCAGNGQADAAAAES